MLHTWFSVLAYTFNKIVSSISILLGLWKTQSITIELFPVLMEITVSGSSETVIINYTFLYLPVLWILLTYLVVTELDASAVEETRQRDVKVVGQRFPSTAPGGAVDHQQLTRWDGVRAAVSHRVTNWGH